MLVKIVFTFLLAISLHLCAEQKNEIPALGTLTFELFKELGDGTYPPVKLYKIHPTGKISSGYGMMYIRNMDNSVSDMPIYIEKNGTILAEDSKDEILFGMNAGYTERFEILIAIGTDIKDSKLVGRGEIVPYPLILKDDKGRVIELLAYSPDGDNFAFKGSGFLPKEKIHFISRSCDEILETDFKTDSFGTFYAGFLPAVIGKTEGPFEVTFSTPNMKPLKLRHLWGKIAFTNLFEYEKVLKEHPFPND